MQLIEPQCSNELKAKFYSKHVSLLDFYKKYLESKQYTNLVKRVKKMASTVSQHLCLLTIISSIKLTKTKLRVQLSDAHLQNVMLFSSSNLSPELQKLWNKKTT